MFVDDYYLTIYAFIYIYCKKNVAGRLVKIVLSVNINSYDFIIIVVVQRE